jgi:hypothetical protein
MTERHGSVRRDLEFLTLPAVAREYRIGLRALRRAAALGKLPLYSAGTKWARVRRADLERWIESTRVTR